MRPDKLAAYIKINKGDGHMTITTSLFTGNLRALLTETFENVQGIYLDRATSLTETLAALNAEQASRPLVAGGATIAGHVEHIRFYIRVLKHYIDGVNADKIDWKQSWLCHAVTPSEWDAIRIGLAADYHALLAHLDTIENWDAERPLGGALAIVVHTAYHLGAIRQMMKAAQ
jgi:hypothetical protein